MSSGFFGSGSGIAADFLTVTRTQEQTSGPCDARRRMQSAGAGLSR